ncbi:MAG TPA: SurA N-terminal domain-containing protein [Kiritimatiellia bacterium]|nr:SurA N-terminal domain-containing protein [Kiritimatiellia bacterium]
MTMLITKFHKLIRSKVLWIGFSTLVIISFVFWGTYDTGPSRAEAFSPGNLFGKPVDIDDFQRARLNTYVAVTLMLGQALPWTNELNEQLDIAAWNRLVTLDKARRLGITADNNEVNQAVMLNPMFQQEGRFDRRFYDGFAQQFLNPMGISKRAFEEHVREEIIMNKLRRLNEKLVLVTPEEINRTFHAFSDTFTVEYALITPDLVAAQVDLTEDDARAFFDKDPSLFEVPDRVRVELIAFSADDFLADLEITDEAIEEFYDFNLDRFEIEVAETPEAGEAEADDPSTDLASSDPDSPFTLTDEFTFTPATVTYQPLEDVRADIEAELRREAALAAAFENANTFVNTLAQRTPGQPRPLFAERAREIGKEPITLEPFARTERLPSDLDAAPGIHRAAFLLTDDYDYSYSDPIPGENGAYVISLLERIPRHIPDFDSVREEAFALAREAAVMDRLTEFSTIILDEARATIQQQDSIESLLLSYGLTVERLEPFTMSTADYEASYAEALIRSVLTHNRREIADLIPVENGMLLIHIIERQPADPGAIPGLRPQIINSVRRQNAGPLFQAYQDYLLEVAGFEPRIVERPALDDDDLM